MVKDLTKKNISTLATIAKLQDFKSRFKANSNNLYGRIQNLSRVIVLPIAVLPIAGLLLGIGGGFSEALLR